VFLHGGYWRALDKSDFSFVAVPFVAQGFAVANVNYDLCPDVTVAAIVDECRRAVAWLVREGAVHGATASPLVVSGHSAGGHLAAMMLATDWTRAGLDRDPVAGAVSVSGVHDLAPMPLFSYNVDLRLDAASAAALSPVNMQPRSKAPIAIVVGAGETSEFRRQAQLLWDAWPANRPRDMSVAGPPQRANSAPSGGVRVHPSAAGPPRGANSEATHGREHTSGPLLVAGRDHFSVIADYADPASELTRSTLALLS